MKPALVLLGVLELATPALSGSAPEAVVVLPFVNLSGAADAPAIIEPVVSRGLVAKGYRIVEGEPVERLLRDSRVRYLDSVTASVRQKLLTELGAGSILFGVIFQAAGGDNPSTALLLRLVRADGVTAWERFGALSADETQEVFGLGRVASAEALVEVLVGRMERSLPRPGAVASAASSRAKPLGRSSPRTYRSAAMPAGKTQRIVVLPFANRSPDVGAGRLASTLAAFRLRSAGMFDVVEPAELRAAILAAGVHSVTDPDPEELKRLSERLGTGLFLTGTVFVYQPAAAGVEAEVELDLTFSDVRSGRVVGSVHHQRKAHDYSGLLELGAIRNAATLSDQVLGEMVTALKDATPKGRQTS